MSGAVGWSSEGSFSLLQFNLLPLSLVVAAAAVLLALTQYGDLRPALDARPARENSRDSLAHRAAVERTIQHAAQARSLSASLAAAVALERAAPARALPFIESILVDEPTNATALDVAEKIYTRLAHRGPASMRHAMSALEVRLRRVALHGLPTHGVAADEWLAPRDVAGVLAAAALRAGTHTVYVGKLRAALQDVVLPCVLRETAPLSLRQLCDRTYTFLAVALERLSGDPFWLELRGHAAWLDDAGYRPRVAALLDASRAYEAFDLPAATSAYLAAGRARSAGGTRAADCWARYGDALLTFHQRDYAATAAALQDLLPVARAASYLALTARIHGLLALSHLRTERYQEALVAYRSMLALNERAGSADDIGHSAASVAQLYLVLGDVERGWPYLRRALEQLASMTSDRRRRMVLLNAAQYAQRTGHPRASVHLFGQAISATRRWGAQEFLAEDLARRALAHWAIGDTADARRDIAEAATYLRNARQHAESPWFDAFVDAVRGMTEAEGANMAIPQLRRALTYFSKAESPMVPHLRLALAKHLATTGSHRAASVEVSRALHHLSRSAPSTREVMLDASLFSDHWRWYADFLEASFPKAGELIEGLEAFRNTGDKHRAGRAGTGRLLRRVQASLGPADRLVLLLELRTSLRVVVVAADAIDVRPPQSDLRALIDAARGYAIAVRDGRSTGGHDRERRTERLVSGLAAGLPTGGRVFVYFTGQLSSLPIEAVPLNGNVAFGDVYQVVRLQRLDAPSASVVTRGQTRHGLVVTTGSQGQDRQLPPLPFVNNEARTVISSMTNRATWLRDEAATRERVLFAARDARFFHYAGHLVSAGGDMGGLLLGDGTTLSLDDLASVDLSALDLVFLATCGGAGGVTMDGTGSLSMAAGVAGRGARAVVGSLWDLRDRDASAIVREFYARYREGKSVSRALQEARLAALSAGVSPGAVWGMVVIQRGIE